MRVVIGYESMYGHTRRLAEAIAEAFPDDEGTIGPVSSLDPPALDADVVIIGAPTHAHGLPRPSSRRTAIDSAHTRYDEHTVDPSAAGPGVREWLEQLPDEVSAGVAVFDTRFRPPGWLVGHPARRVSRALARRGAAVLARPESFFIDRHEHLVPGELERARAWGHTLRERAVNGSVHGKRGRTG